MPERVVPKYVPIMELVYAGAYKATDSTGQTKNIIFSNLTGRRLNRVHVAGIVEAVNEYQARDGTMNYRIRLNDGYSITFVTRSGAIADIAKKNIEQFVEITARGFARRNGRAGWRIEELAPTDPENFIAIRGMALKNLKDDLGTLDPEEIKTMISNALNVLLDEERLNEEFKKILESMKSKVEKKKLQRLRGSAKIEYVAKKLGIPEVMIQYANDIIEHENWILSFPTEEEQAEEEQEDASDISEDFEATPIE